MGYQESYMRMRNSKDFDSLVEVIKSNGGDCFDMSTPVSIITLLKPITTEYFFEPGEKFIYVVGDRSGQRSPKSFFEYCSKVPKHIINNLEIYFTEYFPSYDIFEHNEETQMALHEPFVW